MLTSSLISGAHGVCHGFLTRNGGVSEGVYASLNCGWGSGDDPVAVAQNRARVLDRAGILNGTLITAAQVHSADVRVVEKAWTRDDAPTCDGLVTRVPGLVLGILTADCTPVLFADADAGVIGAAHAGWRGAKGGVLEATLDAMVSQGALPDRIVAAIGPCIHQASYQVGPEFYGVFTLENADDERFFKSDPSSDRFYFDLPGYVAMRLAAWGVAQVDTILADTCADAERFFSYRRSVLQGEKDFGRGISVIALKDAVR